MQRRAGNHPTTQPLRCYRCHRLGVDPAIVVDPAVDKRLRDGRYRDHVCVYCSNGHSWWSLHPEAIRQARGAHSSGGPAEVRSDVGNQPPQAIRLYTAEPDDWRVTSRTRVCYLQPSSTPN
jgi:hypothetical protein